MNALADFLDRIVSPDRPDEPALVRANGRVAFTRGGLGERVRACAGAFARAGIEAGTPVAFGIRQDPDGIAWLLGAMRAGVEVVVLDPGLAPGALVDRCRVAGVRATVTDGVVATVAHNGVLRSLAARRGLALPDPSALAPIHWSTSRALGPVSRLDRLAGGDARRPLAPQAPALVLFTSGTTGAPRGVVHSPAGLAATLTMAANLVELGRGDRVLGTGLHLIGPALLAGATVVVPPTNPSVEGLAALTRRLEVSHVTLPLHKALAWSAAGGAARQLRALWLGSAPVRNQGLRGLASRLPGVELATAYGMTEHLLVATISAADRLAHDEGEGDLVGRPVDGVRIRVADDGEVHVGGQALALGYLGEPMPATELTTGDLGRLDTAGRLVLLGRRKEMLIRDGENIYPGLYEPALAEAAGLAAAMMVGLPGADGDETVVLFAVPRRGEDPESARARLARLVASTQSPLDRHARPDVVLGIAELPRAGRSGKPDRRGLARVAAERLGRVLADDPALPRRRLMRIAVTGATGFVGGAIADHLAAQGHAVLAIGRRARPDGFGHDYASWDLAMDAPAPPGLAACDAVVHAAAHVTPWGPDGPFRSVTVGGTERLLRAIDPGARLVLIGSASVYDPRVPHDRAREPEAPVAPDRYLNAYGRAKADQERLVLASRPDAIVLRPRAVWGPGDTTLLPRILERIRRNRLPLPDGGRHAMSATHISSLTTAVGAAVEHPAVAGPVNVADATPTTPAELLGTLFAALEMSVRIVAVPTPLTWAAAGAAEATWRVLGRSDEPPVTRFAVAGLARPFTLDLGRLHGELGACPDADVAHAARQLRAAVSGPALSGARG